jgi:hypothetical protein
MNKKQLTDIEKRAGNGDNVDGFEVVELCGEIRRLINAFREITECEGPHDMYDIAMDNIAAYSGKKK